VFDRAAGGHRRRQRQARKRVDNLSGKPQGFAARHEHLQPRLARQALGQDPAAFLKYLVAVVQHDQPVGGRAGAAYPRRRVGRENALQLFRYRVSSAVVQPEQHDLRLAGPDPLLCQLHRHAGLADTGRANKREQLRGAHQAVDLDDVGFSADEAGQPLRKPVR